MAIDGLKSFYDEYKFRFQTLTEEQVETILKAAFRIYGEYGYRVQSGEARKILVDAGGSCEGEIVKLPRELILRCLATVAHDLKIYDRSGKLAMHSKGTNTFFGLAPTNPYVDDFETGEQRRGTRQDVINAAIVADACENVDFLMGLAQISDEDLNVQLSDVYEGYEMFTNSTKPAFIWGIDETGLATQVKMAEIIAGGADKLVEKPFLAMFVGCPDTPLSLNERAFKSLKYAVETGLPVIWMGGGQLGSSVPVTLAGAEVVDVCDMLIGVVLSQLIRPGCPLIAGFSFTTVDMKTMTSAYGGPEHCLAESMLADVVHYLGMPTMQTAGAVDSKVLDAQAGVETAMNVLVNVLAGGNFVHDVGFTDGAMSGSLDQIVFCDDVISYAKRIGRGVEVDEDTLAEDVIRAVGWGGNFLATDHTAENFREELWFSKLFDHSVYADWAERKLDMRARVHARTAEILANHRAPALSDEIMAQLRAVLAEAEAAKKQ